MNLGVLGISLADRSACTCWPARLLVVFGSGVFANAITQQRETKSAANSSQPRNVKPSRANSLIKPFGHQRAARREAMCSRWPRARTVTSSQELWEVAPSAQRITGDIWTPVNTGLTATDVRALASNIHPETFLPERWVAVSFDRRTMETPGRRLTMVWIIPLSSPWPSIPAGTSLPERSKEVASTGRRTTAKTGLWWNNGLTNTYVYALAINSGGDIFAATWGGADGIFRPNDNGESWTEVNIGLADPYYHFVRHQCQRGHFRRWRWSRRSGRSISFDEQWR